MINIRRWLSQRDQSLAKTEPVGKLSLGDFMQALESELGPEGRKAFNQLVKKHVPFVMAQQYAPEEMGLIFLAKYLSTPAYKSEVLAGLPSNFHRQLLEKSVQEFGHWTVVALSNLTLRDLTPEQLDKAVANKDWNRIAKKHNPDAELTVSAKPHITQFPVHPEHAQMLSNKNVEFEHHTLDENGISAKMIHEIESKEYPHEPNLYMAKPYHKNIETATKSWVKHPILGWATMATKALYNAGGMGEQCEDVSAHEHENVPLTVHKFAHDHQMVGRAMNKLKHGEMPVNADDVHKIGVMDYLSNNLDRHHGNLMISNHTDATGTHPLLAIDHERSFQYSKPINAMAKWRNRDAGEVTRKETPWAYIKGSPGLDMVHDTRNGWYSHEGLVDWWSKHGQHIKDEMENQLGNIQDETIRNHVRDNFNNRWHKMNNWNEAMKADPEGDNMYDASSLHHAFQDTHNTQPAAPRITAKQLRSLPKNKRDALSAITDIVNKKQKLTFKQRGLLQHAVDSTIGSMTPEEAGETFRSLAENPYLETKAIRNEPSLDPRQRMLRFFTERKWEHNEPEYKYAHMEAMANAIDGLPPQKKEILKHWADHLRRLVAEREAA